MTLTDVLEELLIQLKTLAPVYRFGAHGDEKTAHFTWYPVSTTARYSVSCVGSIGDTELVQVDVWAKGLEGALELERQAVDLLIPLGYTLGAATRTLDDAPWSRRVLTLRRYI